jgi:hypothetical protein
LQEAQELSGWNADANLEGDTYPIERLGPREFKNTLHLDD